MRKKLPVEQSALAGSRVTRRKEATREIYTLEGTHVIVM
jgi:hypothetical protein